MNNCDWCKNPDEKLTRDRIKNKNGYFCENCLCGWYDYVDAEIKERKINIRNDRDIDTDN